MRTLRQRFRVKILDSGPRRIIMAVVLSLFVPSQVLEGAKEKKGCAMRRRRDGGPVDGDIGSCKAMDAIRIQTDGLPIIIENAMIEVLCAATLSAKERS